MIEKAYKGQQLISGKWKDRNVRYFTNNGFDGDPGGWIWVREVGANTHPHTGSYSMFLIDIGASLPGFN